MLKLQTTNTTILCNFHLKPFQAVNRTRPVFSTFWYLTPIAPNPVQAVRSLHTACLEMVPFPTHSAFAKVKDRGREIRVLNTTLMMFVLISPLPLPPPSSRQFLRGTVRFLCFSFFFFSRSNAIGVEKSHLRPGTGARRIAGNQVQFSCDRASLLPAASLRGKRNAAAPTLGLPRENVNSVGRREGGRNGGRQRWRDGEIQQEQAGTSYTHGPQMKKKAARYESHSFPTKFVSDQLTVQWLCFRMSFDRHTYSGEAYQATTP